MLVRNVGKLAMREEMRSEVEKRGENGKLHGQLVVGILSVGGKALGPLCDLYRKS